MPASLYRKVGLASAVMISSVMLSRAIGLAREMAIAYVAGAGADVDAYQVAFIIPEILNHVVATGFLSVTFIPIFTRHMLGPDESAGWRSFSTILCVFGTLALGCVLLSMLLAPDLVALAAPGLKTPRVVAAAVRMTRIILPAQFFFFVGGLLMAVQFARERFVLPALAPLLYNIGIIAGGFLLGPWLGIEGFAWGVLAGAFSGNLLVQWLGARRVGMRFQSAWSLRHPDIPEYVKRTLPLMLGLTMTFSTEFLFRFFGSFLPSGSIAVLNFSLRVMLLMVGIFGQAVGTASFPFMARLAVENNMAELNRLLNRTLRFLALLLPVAAVLMILSGEIVRVLFEHGRFDPAATRLTAAVLVWFLAGAFAFAAYTIVVRAYFATRNTLFPALFGTVAVLACIPLYPLGVKLMGVEGIAMAVSVSGILQVGVLFHLWSRRSANTGSLDVYGFYLKMALLSAIVAPVLAAVRWGMLSLVDPSSTAGSLVVIAIVGSAFAGLMVAAGYGCRIREITGLFGRLVKLTAGG
jgi:putative peptidoglycan lipid II flippase